MRKVVWLVPHFICIVQKAHINALMTVLFNDNINQGSCYLMMIIIIIIIIKWVNFKFLRFVLVGLVSAGFSCGKPGQPGIYHRCRWWLSDKKDDHDDDDNEDNDIDENFFMSYSSRISSTADWVSYQINGGLHLSWGQLSAISSILHDFIPFTYQSSIFWW